MPQRWGHIGGIRKHWLTGQQNFKSKTTVPLSFCLNSLSHTHTHFPTLHLYTPPQPTTITNHLILLLLHAFSLKKKEGVPVWTDVEISAVCQWIITFPGSLCILICLTVYRVYPFECMKDTFHSFLQPEDLVARILSFFFAWVFLNQFSNWRHKWTPTAGISWSRFSCPVRVTGHPVS